MNWHRSSKRREARAPQSRELLGRALKNGALKQMSTGESVAHQPPAPSIPRYMVNLTNRSDLFAFRPGEWLTVLEPVVARVEEIGRWAAGLEALAQAHTAQSLPQNVLQEMAAITQRLANAADEIAWDLGLVVDALRAAQKGGCA